VRLLANFDAEVQALDEVIDRCLASDITAQGICLVCRTVKQLEQYEAALQARDRQTVRLTGESSDDPTRPGIRTATMHRVKGLEFDVLLIAGVNDAVLPLLAAAQEIDSPHARQEFEIRERSLLYVAATRARKHVLVTAHGEPSRLLSK